VNEQKALESLRRAAERRKVADDERHAASAELRKRVRDAHTASPNPTQIAPEARLSRQAIYEALQPS
jgi:hypothetical protein